MNNILNDFYQELKRGIPGNSYTCSIGDKTILDITFQTDAQPGVTIPELLTIVYLRLNQQNKEKPSRKVSLALTKIEEAVLWLASVEEDK